MTVSSRESQDEQRLERNDRLKYDAPMFEDCAWDKDNYSIDKWLKRTAHGTLKDTKFGRYPDEEGPHDVLFEDPLLMQVYLIDLALFLGAEKTAFLTSAALVGFAPDEAAQVYFSSQVMDEARHYEVFCRRMADLGITPEKRKKIVDQYVTPGMKKFHELVLEQADKKDFTATVIAQNLIMEGMAYPVYRYEYKYWSVFDPSLKKIIRGAFADEAHHVGLGETIIKNHYQTVGTDEKNKVKRLLKEFSVLMTEIFEGVINHYVGMYQECANAHIDLIGDIEIFKGHKMYNLSEEDQVRILLKEINYEHNHRLERLGIV